MTLLRHHINTLRLRIDAPWPRRIRYVFKGLRLAA